MNSHYGIIAFFPGFGTGDSRRAFDQDRSVVKGQYIIIRGILRGDEITGFLIEHHGYFTAADRIDRIGFGEKCGIILYGHKNFVSGSSSVYFRGPFVQLTAGRIFGHNHQGIIIGIVSGQSQLQFSFCKGATAGAGITPFVFTI